MAGEVHNVSFQLWPQVWPLETGHRLRLEVTGNDMPYLLQNNTPFVLRITRVALKVPRA